MCNLKKEQMKILKFSGDWCQPCKALQAVLEDVLPYDFPEIDLVEVDVKKDPDMTREWGIRSVPTLILIDSDDNWLKTSVGFMDNAKLKAWLTNPNKD
jgi:thioredoxin-like negative regulator of GroEL